MALPPSPRRLERLLIIEDNPRLRSALSRSLAMRARDVQAVAKVSEALELLHGYQPELIILDFSLPDGDAFDVLRAVIELQPAPSVVAISGIAKPLDAFQLALLGVRAFVPKPLDEARLQAAIDRALERGPDLTPHLRAAVGHRGLHEVEQEVRAAMVSEAMARAHGSRNRAARLLSISRQLLQHVLRRTRP